MWSASVLTTVSSDTEPTIVVTFDSAKYIFNVGENTNRAFLQSRSNWKRTRGMFFTEIGTKRCGGFPGLLMSLADATISHLDVVGPPGLLHFMSAMRSYTYRESLTVQPIEYSWNAPLSTSPEPLYKDANISVYGIPVVPSSEPQHPSPALSTDASPEVGSKRKRSPSPDLPGKRLASNKKDDPLASLKRLMQAPDFLPASLEGSDANEWRRLMINEMFPATQMKEQKGSRHRSGEKQKRRQGSQSKPEVQSDIETSSRQSEHASFQGNNTVTQNRELPLDDVISEANSYKRSQRPKGFNTQLPKFIPHTSLTRFTTPTLAYLVVGPHIRGKFNVEAAVALGIPDGPLRGQLTKGKTITFDTEVDGEIIKRTVRPEECIGESEAPSALLILDIPTTTHIPALLSSFDSSTFYSKLQSGCSEDVKEQKLKIIFHLCGKGVLEDHRYIAFMNSFPPDVQHVIASREHSPDPVTFTSVAYNQLRLNQLDPMIFPLPKFSLKPKKDLETIPGLPLRRCPLASNQEFNMRKSDGPSLREAQDHFHAPATSTSPLRISASLSRKFTAVKEVIEDNLANASSYTPKGADVKVIPLGTSSAMPSKYRNVSSTLIQIPNWGDILLDVGEGTWSQLVRQFGSDDDIPNNVWDTLRHLKCIYVSHMHGDHHIGLAHILAKRRELDPPPSSPLYLVTLRPVHLYIRELSDLQDLGLNDPLGGVIPVMSESLHWKSPGTYQTQGMWQLGGSEPWTDLQTSLKNAKDMCRDLGLERFSTVDMFHRIRCYGAVIKHTDGWTIAYSGDTQPTNTLVVAAKDATLLIHEATMADDEAEMAKQKAHSTIGQALDVGKRMKAEHILLTHFSARYPKAPPSVMSPKKVSSRTKEPIVALAFDHMNITIGNMWKLNHYLPAIEQSFLDTTTEEGDVMENEANEAAGVDIALG